MVDGHSQARAQDRQRRILDAALSVFTRRGYGAASVDEIADESATSKGGVYFHFPSKQSIFGALLDLAASRLMKKIDEAIEAESEPVARADAALLAVLRTFAEHRSLARLFMVEALGAGGEFQQRLLALHDEFIAVIKLHLDEAVASGVIASVDTMLVSRAWFGALNEIILHWVMKKEPEPLEAAYDALRPVIMRSVGIEPAVQQGTGQKEQSARPPAEV
jgi:TetR/AcrR family transcriptional regulator, fatty acid metabolism regulator protein